MNVMTCDVINISTAFSVPFDAAATAAIVARIVGIFSIFDDACIADIMDVTYIVHDSLWGLRRLCRCRCRCRCRYWGCR